MGFLRGLGTAVCSILLFLTLSVFSAAFLVNGTVLNTDFMNKQIDKLDISSIVRDTVNEQIQKDLTLDSEFITGVVFTIVDKEEPAIKEQMHNGMNDAYDYFLGKTNVFAIDISLTAIKKDLSDNAYQIAVEYLKVRMSTMSDAEADQYAGEIAAQIPPADLPATLLALPEGLRTDIIKEYIKSLGGKSVFNPLFFGLDFLIEPQVQAGLQQYVSETTADIQDSYTIDETTIDSGTMQTLRDVKQGISYFKMWYAWLIVLMVVLAGLIFLINWKNLRASVFALGLDLVIFGILDLAGILILKNVKLESIIFRNTDVSVSLQNWITGLMSDITGIVLWLSIAILIVGAGLITASFFIKKPEAQA